MSRPVKKLLPGAEPFFKEGNPIGFLFLHGFTATPFEGKYLCDYIYEELNWTISAPLLPGHGTEPKDLIGISWKNWLDCVKNEHGQLHKRCKKIVVCGQSMGGTLALLLASQLPVDAVITLAGAVLLKDWRLIILPIAKHLITYNKKSKGPDIWDKSLKPLIPTYSMYPLMAVEEFVKLLNFTKGNLWQIQAPALLFHSRKDRTIHFSNLEYIYQHISSKIKEMVVLEKSYHLISLDMEREEVYKKIRSFLTKIF